jgi:hypothetical protein
MSRSNLTCNDCKETIKPDEWACKCLCIDCGPCKEKCKSNADKLMKE